MSELKCSIRPEKPRATNPAFKASATVSGLNGSMITPCWLHPGDHPPLRGGGGLALGQAIDHVVVGKHGEVNVAPDSMHEMIAALGVAVAVAGVHQDFQVVIGDLGRGRQRQGPAMQRVKHVALHELRGFGRLADAGDDQHLLRASVPA